MKEGQKQQATFYKAQLQLTGFLPGVQKAVGGRGFMLSRGEDRWNQFAKRVNFVKIRYTNFDSIK